jgi:hypothetical protein
MASIPPRPKLFRGHTLSNGLTGCWRCAENSGLTLYDIAGQDKHAPITGSGTSWVGGKYGSAINFNGSTDYADTSTAMSSFITATAATLCCWCYPTGSSPYIGALIYGQGIMIDYGVGAIGFYRGQLSGVDGIYAATYYSGDYVRIPYTASTWIHIALVLDPANGYLYAYGDGVLVGSSYVGGSITLTGTLRFASRYSSGGGNYFAGSMDDMRIYNRALSASEIAQIYAGHG